MAKAQTWIWMAELQAPRLQKQKTEPVKSNNKLQRNGGQADWSAVALKK